MTPYHFDNQEKKQRSSRTKLIVTGVTVLVVIVLSVFIISPVMKTIIKGPAWLATAVQNSVSDTITLTLPKKVIFEKYQEMKAIIDTQSGLQLELEQVKNENAELRKELNYQPIANNSVLAQVIGKPNHSLFNTLVLDVGTNQGIHIGQLVTTQKTLGIGTITQVTNSTATVELFGGPSFSGDMVLMGKNITLPATGKGSGNFEIHIPREIAVSENDLLVFPTNPSMVVGVVKSIIFDARDPFQTVLARAPINIQELRFVEVVQ